MIEPTREDLGDDILPDVSQPATLKLVGLRTYYDDLYSLTVSVWGSMDTVDFQTGKICYSSGRMPDPGSSDEGSIYIRLATRERIMSESMSG